MADTGRAFCALKGVRRMVEAITRAVCAALCEGGINAARSFPDVSIDEISESLVCVDARSVSAAEGAFADYLGLRRREDGAFVEVFGQRCDFSLSVDIFVRPERGGALCAEIFDGVVLALGNLREGMKICGVSRGKCSFDGGTGLLLCACEVSGVAFLICEGTEETGEFTDFVLKGEIR